MMLRADFNSLEDLHHRLDTVQKIPYKKMVQDLRAEGWEERKCDDRHLLFSADENWVIKPVFRRFCDFEFARFCRDNPFAKQSANIVNTPYIGSTSDTRFFLMERLDPLAEEDQEAAQKLEEAYTGARVKNRKYERISLDNRKTTLEELDQNYPDMMNALRAIQAHAIWQFKYNRYPEDRCVMPCIDVKKEHVMARQNPNGSSEIVLIDPFLDGGIKKITTGTRERIELLGINPDHIRRTPDPFVLAASENQFGTFDQE